MTVEMGPPATCPSCGGPVRRPPASAGRGGIVGGVSTPAEIEAAARPSVERAATARPEGAVTCASCGERLHRRGDAYLPHRIAKAVLPMWVAADRLRNHLRRLAIVRLGRIDGDCYFLPFIRMEGTTPEGDETFTILAASIGEERLERPFLPAADIKPFEPPEEGSAGGAGTGSAVIRLLPPTIPKPALVRSVEAVGWRPSRELELIHYPFWLMRVEDRGRIEGAWMDGIEGRLIHHRIRLTPPIPARGAVARLTALPAAAAGALAAPLALPGAAAAWTAGIPLLYYALLRRWRG